MFARALETGEGVGGQPLRSNEAEIRSACRGGERAFCEYVRAACLTTQDAKSVFGGLGGPGGPGGPDEHLQGARPLQADM